MMVNRTAYLPADETAMFCEQVSLLLQSGIALHDGMEALAQSYSGTRYADQFERLSRIIKDTGFLHEAVGQLSIFPPYMVDMVRIGERAGTLERVMQGLALYYDREHQLRITIKNAVSYPLLMMALMAVVVTVLIVRVLPMFSEILGNLGGNLPASATARMDMGMGAGAFVLALTALVMAVVVLVAALIKLGRRDQVARFFLRGSRRLRYIAGRLSAGRFASAMQMLIGSGFPLEQALALAEDVAADSLSKDKVRMLRAQTNAGKAFADAVESAGIFDPLHAKMIRIGHLSGQTETVMARLADLYQDEADDAIRRLVAAIEPTLVAVLSIVIGGILLAVMLPLANLMSSLG
jgi:type IV pilus assembly protein PilC